VPATHCVSALRGVAASALIGHLVVEPGRPQGAGEHQPDSKGRISSKGESNSDTDLGGSACDGWRYGWIRNDSDPVVCAFAIAS
jgi:hypothetical protein